MQWRVVVRKENELDLLNDRYEYTLGIKEIELLEWLSREGGEEG